MNEPEQTPSAQDGEPVAALRLRSERPPVMRLSRKVLTGLASVAAVTVAGALIWALYQGNRKTRGGPELYNTENRTRPRACPTCHGIIPGSPRTPRPHREYPRSARPCRAISGARYPALKGRAQEPSIRNSSASLKKPKQRAPAVCSPLPVRGSSPRRRPRSPLLPTRRQQH